VGSHEELAMEQCLTCGFLIRFKSSARIKVEFLSPIDFCIFK